MTILDAGNEAVIGKLESDPRVLHADATMAAVNCSTVTMLFSFCVIAWTLSSGK